MGWFTDHIVNLDGADFVSAPRPGSSSRTASSSIASARRRPAIATTSSPRLFDLLHRPVPERYAPPGSQVDVATFGNSYPFRAMLMGPLIDAGEIHTVIYGIPSWNVVPKLKAVYRPEVFGLAKSGAMRAAKIALNTNQFAELGGVNKRSSSSSGPSAPSTSPTARASRSTTSRAVEVP